MKKLLLSVALLAFVGLLASCEPNEVETTTFTVTFDTSDGGSLVESQEVENGDKVTKPNDPTRDGFQFSGRWMNGSFAWDFDLDIVTSDLVLVAQWTEISSTPTAVRMSDDIFSSTLVWQQTDASGLDFVVSMKPQNGSMYEVVEGIFDINDDQLLNVVTFTPDVIPLGGYYDVKITVGSETVDVSDVLFGGSGEATNPYLVSKVSDLLYMLETPSVTDKHFLQINDILSTLTEGIEITNDRKASLTGVYDGGGFSVSFTGNGGLFHEIKATGVVKNLVIDSTTNLFGAESNLYPIGAVADKNEGRIENISSRALLENARLQGELPVFTTVDTTDLTTGAGGIVGLNAATGTIKDVTVGGAGAVKAGRGIGGVAAYNFGMIEQALVTATLPAGNQANSAKSSNTYSYGGGIAGFNFGTINEATVSGRVFAQSAYAEAGNGNEGKNVVFGGIVGYNEGLITNSSFARNLSSKEFIDKTRAGELEDSANNLGVASIHGDLYVGGIAGINAGDIEDVYVGGAIIAARDFVGGVTGLTLLDGMISNAYVFAEVAIKDEGGVKLSAPNDKTTLQTYDIAPSGFDQNTVVFKRLVNSETSQTWVPGDLAMPMLPAFTTDDLAKVGDAFADSGVLLFQSGQVTGVDIALDSVVLPFGTELQLDFTVLPSSAPDTYTTWSSSDESVVTISGEGLLQGIGAGTAVVTVTTRDGGLTDTISVTVEEYEKVTNVNVTADGLTLPTPNDSTDRPKVEIDTVMTLTVELGPEEADFKGYSISSSNSRATVDGNVVTFVYGASGPGRVSITISFEDSSVASLEYRFETFEEVVVVDAPITSVSITSPDITLPVPNDDTVRDDIEIGTTISIVVADILPLDASNKNYSISVSNSRGSVDGNQVTFSSLGLISIYVEFEDTSIGDSGRFNFRFTIIEGAPADVPITSVTITAAEMTLPEANNADIRPEIEVGSTLTLTVDILPLDASNQNYTITTSNSRAEEDGNEVTFVVGSGLGSVSIYVDFEDTSVGDSGRFNFRFTTIDAPPADVPITSVTITAAEMTLPEANNADIRPEVEVGTTLTLTVDILPLDASNQNYTITTSNSRAEEDGNEVTFVVGSGLGKVSIKVTFEDTSVGDLGVFEFRFTTIDAPPADVPITSVTITAAEMTLPAFNDDTVRPEVEVGTTLTLTVDILPLDASNQNYAITTSNSRAEEDGNEVTFVVGSGLGSVSIYVDFEDTSVGDSGRFNFRFTTIDAPPADVPITSVTITAAEMTLPEANNADIRPEVEVGTTLTLTVDILPLDASNQNYTITTSNSRAVVDGNVVTIVYGNTGPGSVSVNVVFEDTSVGNSGKFEYRFTTFEAVPITSVSITSPDITLPVPNDDTVRDDIEIGTTISVVVADILPLDATNKNYSISVSNSRGSVDGNQVTFSSLGLISIYVEFEDTSIGDSGRFNFRFTIIAAPAEVPITSVTITAGDLTLPAFNDITVRPEVLIGVVVTLTIDILPLDASNQNYTITTSNSRAVVNGNEVTFVFGDTGPGNVSIVVTFEDTSVGDNGEFEFRFKTIETTT